MKNLYRKILILLAQKEGLICNSMTVKSENAIFTVKDGKIKEINFYEEKTPGFSIFNRILTKKEIKALYNNQLKND